MRLSDGDVKINISSGISLATNFKAKIKYNIDNNLNKNLFPDLKYLNDVVELEAELLNNLSINLDETYRLISYNFKNSGKITKTTLILKMLIGNELFKKNVGFIVIKKCKYKHEVQIQKKISIKLDGKYSFDKGNLLDFKLNNIFKKDFLKLNLDAEYDNLVKIDFINYKKRKT